MRWSPEQFGGDDRAKSADGQRRNGAKNGKCEGRERRVDREADEPGAEFGSEARAPELEQVRPPADVDDVGADAGAPSGPKQTDGQQKKCALPARGSVVDEAVAAYSYHGYARS